MRSAISERHTPLAAGVPPMFALHLRQLHCKNFNPQTNFQMKMDAAKNSL
jgi:hypothetical protein